MRLSNIYISFLFILFLQLQGKSQDIAVSAKLDTNLLLIGDQTILHLYLIQEEGKKVYWPPIDEKIGDKIEVLNFSTFDTTYLANSKNIKIHLQLLITTFDTGLIIVPPLPFVYDYANDSTSKTALTPQLFLRIFVLKVDLEKGIIDIKPIMEEPLTFWEVLPYLLALLILSILFLFGIYIWVRVANNKPIFSLPKKPPIPAHITALKELEKLKEKKLWQVGSQKEYYSLLTDIMRSYMEGRLGFGAMEMISDDIIKELHKLGIDNELINDSQEVLQMADFVKFAKTQALADENNRAMKWAYDFVENTKPKEDNNNKKEEEIG